MIMIWHMRPCTVKKKSELQLQEFKLWAYLFHLQFQRGAPCKYTICLQRDEFFIYILCKSLLNLVKKPPKNCFDKTWIEEKWQNSFVVCAEDYIYLSKLFIDYTITISTTTHSFLSTQIIWMHVSTEVWSSSGQYVTQK
jgi:hypothetical protein